VSSRKRPISLEDMQKIAAEATERQPCQDCGTAPGAPCTQPGRGRSICKSRWIAAAIAIRQQARGTRRTPEQEAILAALPRVSREEIEACRTPAGGYSFTRARLAAWGVPYPPPAGWLQALLRDEDGADARHQ